jgi:hypothetical protein
MTWRTPLIIAAVYAAMFCALCFAASHALAAPATHHAHVCAEDDACWTWPTMGNHKRGVVGFTGARRVVGPCQYSRLVRYGLLSPRTPRLRGDYLAIRLGCTR